MNLNMTVKADSTSLGQAVDLGKDDFSSEIDAIQKEIEEIFSAQTKELIDSSALISRIDGDIQVLTMAMANQRKKNALKKKIKANNDALEKIQLGSYHEGTGTENRNETELALRTANEELERAKEALKEQVDNNEIKRALMSGLTTVEMTREFIKQETIKYEIVSVGTNNNGETVLLHAQPTLAELFEGVSYDDGALKITETAKQFSAILNNIEQGEQQKALSNTVLNQMSRIELNNNETNLWNVFVDLQEKLRNIGGGTTMNFGQLTESLIEYGLSDDLEITVDRVFELLEKGRNNLAYYLGADVDEFQVKALVTYGSTGRADIATLSNVVNPLKKIRRTLANFKDQEHLQAAMEKLFTARAGQGDRPFKPAAAEIVRKEIKETLDRLTPGFK